jgi:photosystem II stability/assembly factor-like uncharacterized protein
VVKKFTKHLVKLLLVVLTSFSLTNAQWIRTSGPVGCTSQSMITYGNDLLLGASDEVIYRTSTRTACWEPIFDPHITGNPSTMAVVDSVVLAGYTSFGVYRSLDGGGTWIPANDGLGNSGVFALTSGGGTAYVSAYQNGVYRSTDKGAHWVAVSHGLPPGSSPVLTLGARGTTVLAGTYAAGIYRSTDQGVSWKRVTDGYTISSIAVNDSTWFAGTSNGAFRSDDDGVTWTLIDFVPELYRTSIVAVHGVTVYAASVTGTYRSDDNGRHWVNIDSGVPSGLAFTAFAFHDQTVYACIGGAGVYASNDKGTTWLAFSQGLANTQIGGCVAAGTSVFTVSALVHNVNSIDRGLMVSRSDDAGITWTILAPTAKIPTIGSIGAVGKRMFGAASNGVVEIVGDSAIVTSMTNVPYRLKSIRDTLYICTNLGFYRSCDTARTWMWCGKPSVEYNDFAGTGQEIYFGTSEYGFSRSLDTGKSFQQINEGLNYSFVRPPVIRALTIFGKGLYSIIDGNIMFLERGTAQWYQMQMGLSGTPYLLCTVGKTLVTVTTDGLFTLQRDDTTWTRATRQIESPPPMLTMATDGTMLYAGTQWTGVWRRPLSDLITAVCDAIPLAPFGYQLEQNYPNPFNPSTTIRFSLPSRSLVTLKIYDVLGKEVETIVNKELSIGTYSVKWNAESMPSGVYFYRLKAGGYTETKRLILMR